MTGAPAPADAVDPAIVARWRATGFAVLRGACDAGALSAEMDRAFSDGLRADPGSTVGSGAISFRFLPMMCERTPESLRLIDAFAGPAAALLGRDVLPVRAKGTRYFGESAWHRDSELDVASVGFLAYLEPLAAGNGALRVQAASHLDYGSAPDTAAVGEAVATDPGDVVVFDEHLVHGSTRGHDRRQWRVDFVADPGDAAEEARVREYFSRMYPAGWDGGYDAARYPSYGPHWQSSGRAWVERLRDLGVYAGAEGQERATRAQLSAPAPEPRGSYSPVVRHAVYLPPFGTFGDVHRLLDLARAVEDAGWDGFFMWDHLLFEADVPFVDTWIALAAIAVSTERIRLGPLVTPIPRRRPWKVAREAVTLDHLSNGRLVLGVGLGIDFWREFGAFSGEADDDIARAALLDDGIEILTKLWSGESVSHTGARSSIENVCFLPRPLQQPRIPIWSAALSPLRRGPTRHAARVDGVMPFGPERPLTPHDVRGIVADIGRERVADTPFDVCVHGPREQADAFEDAGVTWYCESFYPEQPLDDVRRRIDRGPPGT